MWRWRVTSMLDRTFVLSGSKPMNSHINNESYTIQLEFQLSFSLTPSLYRCLSKIMKILKCHCQWMRINVCWTYRQKCPSIEGCIASTGDVYTHNFSQFLTLQNSAESRIVSPFTETAFYVIYIHRAANIIYLILSTSIRISNPADTTDQSLLFVYLMLFH